MFWSQQARYRGPNRGPNQENHDGFLLNRSCGFAFGKHMDEGNTRVLNPPKALRPFQKMHALCSFQA